MVYDSYPKQNLQNAGTAIPDYLERREQAPSLESLAIVAEFPQTLAGEGPPQRLIVARVSPSLFDVLRIAPTIGRAFTEDEATLGNESVVILSHGLWNTRFGARRDIVGSDIRLDGTSFRVIGVMPENFGFTRRDIDAYVPFAFTAEQMSDAARGNQFSISVGRLRDGATVAGLEAELAAIVQRNVAEGRLPADAVTVAGFTGRAEPLRELQVGNLREMLLMLQAIVFVVLLIACANLANLQLTRLASRRKELAVRAALGAAGQRIVGMVLVEALLLAVAGGAVGLAVASAGLALVRMLGLDRSNNGFDLTLDTTTLAYTVGAALLAGLVSGLPPVLALLRDDLTGAIREGGRQGGGGRRAQRMRGTLVVAQLAMSVMLLVGAGLLTKSFYGLLGEGPGFNSGNVWTARVALAGPRYAERDSWPRFQGQALAAFRALPGVSAAGMTSILPFAGNNEQGSTDIEGYEVPQGGSPPHAQHRSIDEGYLAALGLPVVAGRNFAPHEPEPVVIVDETLAAKYWPNGNPLGQRLRRNFPATDRWFTIIGVVPAVKHASLAETTVKETIYWHYEQRPQPAAVFALRTVVPPSQLAGAVSAAVARSIRKSRSPMRGRRRRVERLPARSTPMVLTLVFAGVAFALAIALRRARLGREPARQRDRRAYGARRAHRGHRPDGPPAGRQAHRDRAPDRCGGCGRARPRAVVAARSRRLVRFDCAGADRGRPRRRGTPRELVAGAARGTHRSARGAAPGVMIMVTP
jgi:predicted permease